MLNLPHLRAALGGVPWHRAQQHLLDGVAPGFFDDAKNGRYSLNGQACADTDLYTLTNPSTARNYIDADGLTKTAAANTIRYDYTNGTRQRLLEGLRTNICVSSKTSAAFAANSVPTPACVDGADVAPDGTMTAWKFASGYALRAQRNITIAADTGSYAWSVYAKAVSANAKLETTGLGVNAVSQFSGVIYDFDTDTLAANFQKRYIGNGWFRFWRIFTNNGTSGLFINALGLASGGNSNALIWQSDVVKAGGISSPIFTTSAAVTIPADVCQLTPAAAAVLLGATSIAIRGTVASTAAYQQLVSLDDGTVNNRRSIAVGVSGALGQFRIGTWVGSSATFSEIMLNNSITAQQPFGAVAAYDNTGAEAKTHGGLSGTGTGSGTPTVNSYTIGSRTNGADSFPVSLSIHELVAWPIRGSTAALAAQARLAA